MLRYGRLGRFRLNKSASQIDAAVRSLVRNAYTAVPAFRRRMDATRLVPEAIRTHLDLLLLPPVDRTAFVGDETCAFLRTGTVQERCKRSQTSGTTGVPIDVVMSRTESTYRKVLLFRAIRNGVRLPFPVTIAEVGTGVVGLARRGPSQHLGLVRVVRISRLLHAEAQLERLMEAQADVITGHPSCLGIVAEAARSAGARLRPRAVVCRGELLDERTRAQLHDVFACKILDYYNCDEIGNIAWECPHDPHTLHVNTDGCTVSIVGDDGTPVRPGAEGRVVVTNLYNWTMPFIQYDLGDRGALKPTASSRCSCGFRGPSMALLSGRQDDVFRMPDGRLISPRTLTSLVASAVSASPEAARPSHARRYQIIQQTPRLIRVKLILFDDAPDDLDVRVVAALRQLSDAVECQVEYVKEIAPEPSGKFREVKSELPNLP